MDDEVTILVKLPFTVIITESSPNAVKLPMVFLPTIENDIFYNNQYEDIF